MRAGYPTRPHFFRALDTAGGGLHLLVKDSGARSWAFRFMRNGTSRDIGLGAAGPNGISLADARDARDALRLKVKAGIEHAGELCFSVARELPVPGQSIAVRSIPVFNAGSNRAAVRAGR